MRSKTTRKFRDALAALPVDVRERANEAYALFRVNPHHPSLRFKKVHTTLPIFSAQITRDYRAVGIIDANIIVWFWIGTHAKYERLLGSL